jgi:hypothetical protein
MELVWREGGKILSGTFHRFKISDSEELESGLNSIGFEFGTVLVGNVECDFEVLEDFP